MESMSPSVDFVYAVKRHLPEVTGDSHFTITCHLHTIFHHNLSWLPPAHTPQSPTPPSSAPLYLSQLHPLILVWSMTRTTHWSTYLDFLPLWLSPILLQSLQLPLCSPITCRIRYILIYSHCALSASIYLVFHRHIIVALSPTPMFLCSWIIFFLIYLFICIFCKITVNYCIYIHISPPCLAWTVTSELLNV